jgi:hypothetical protein
MKSRSGQCRCRNCGIEIFFPELLLEWKTMRDAESFTFINLAHYVLFDKS